MTLPILHDNGTPARMLAASAEAAYAALEAAYDLLKQTAPNARDHEPFDFTRAVEEHHERQQHIAAVMEDMERLIWHCEEQGGIPDEA